MGLFFSETKPRTCCCGCSLTCGMITMIVLATLELLVVATSPEVTFAACLPSLIFVVAGIVSVVSGNPTIRVVIFWVWAVAAGVGFVIFLLYLILSSALLGPLLIPMWLFFALIICPLIYLELGIAWYYIEEAKDNEDSEY